jgi:predicted ATPase
VKISAGFFELLTFDFSLQAAFFNSLVFASRATTRRYLRMARIVITGAPGAGKTTLLLALQARGYIIVGDSARAIIQDRRRRGLSPRPDAYEMAQEALRMDIENFVHHAATPGHVFFDRSVLDALCGIDQVTPLNESELSEWLSKYQYCSKVFVLPPWKAIYVTDAERDHTFEHAESVNTIAQEWYRRCGYQVLEVPKVSVEERCTYVLQALANTNA